MFLLKTPNIRLKHLNICYKSYWGQRSPKGHSRSSGVTKCKKLNNCNTSKILKFFQYLRHLTLAYNQRKSSDNIMV